MCQIINKGTVPVIIPVRSQSIIAGGRDKTQMLYDYIESNKKNKQHEFCLTDAHLTLKNFFYFIIVCVLDSTYKNDYIIVLHR